MLKAATPVGASNNKGFLFAGEFSTNACCRHLIKWDFPVPAVPCMIILRGGFGEGALKCENIVVKAIFWVGDNV